MDEEELMEKAIIYRKESSRPLSNYHNRMTEAAQQICKNNPAMLCKRQALIESAHCKIIEEGFQFVMGRSCAKSSESQITPKRRKISLDVREKQLQEVQEDISDLKDRISYKEKRHFAAENVRD